MKTRITKLLKLIGNFLAECGAGASYAIKH